MSLTHHIRVCKLAFNSCRSFLRAGVPNLSDLISDDLRWSGYSNNYVYHKRNMLEWSTNHHSPYPTVHAKTVFHETDPWCQKKLRTADLGNTHTHTTKLESGGWDFLFFFLIIEKDLGFGREGRFAKIKHQEPRCVPPSLSVSPTTEFTFIDPFPPCCLFCRVCPVLQ